EWSFDMLKDAALLVAELELELMQEGLANDDCNPWNVLFDGVRPVYVDFSSILSDGAACGATWPGFDEFMRTFVYPLRLMSMGHDHIARWLMHDRDRGVEPADFDAINRRFGPLRTARNALQGARNAAARMAGPNQALARRAALV